MSAVTTQRQVDERTIVAGTTARFVQLAALLILSSGSLLSPLWDLARSVRFGGLGCLLAAGVDPNNGDVAANYVPFIVNSAAFHACTARYEPAPLTWASYACAFGVLVLAGLLTLLLPGLTRRWRHLLPLADVDPSGRLRDAVDTAAERAGLAAPTFCFDPFSRGNGAMVFGRNSHPFVCLDADLVAIFERDRAAFDAVILHELAHIRNRDVTVSTATLAVWRVYIALVALPSLSALLWSAVPSFGPGGVDPFWRGEAPTYFRSVLFPVLLTVLAYLARADVLRAREVYADITARDWGASAHAWEQPDPSVSGVRRLLSLVRDAGRWHPRWSVRGRALVKPDTLFRVDSLQMFLAGSATIMIAVNGGVYINSDSGFGAQVALAPVLLAAAAAVAVVGVALWRAVAYAVLNDRDVPSGITAGFWFGAGLALGEWETGRPATIQFVPSRPWLELVVLCAGVGFCWWVAACARLWFAAWPGADKRPALAVVLVAAALLTATWLYWWPGQGGTLMVGLESIRTTTDQIQQRFAGTDSAHRGLLHALALLEPVWAGWSGMLNMLAGSVLWFVPLIGMVAGTFRNRPAADVPGGFDGRNAPPVRPLAWALTVGTVAAIGGIAVAKAAIHVGFPAPDRYTALFTVMVLSWICVAIALAAIAAAAVASALVQQHRLPVALVAATMTTVIGLMTTFFVESADGCMRPLANSMHACVWMPDTGWNLTALLSMPALTFSNLAAFTAALVISAVVGTTKKFRKQEPQPNKNEHTHEPDMQPRHKARVFGAATVVLAALVAVVVPTARSVQGQSNRVGSEEVNAVALEADTPVHVPNSIKAIQLQAWLYYGGQEFEQRFGDKLDQLGRHLDQAAAASPSGSLSAQWVLTFEADCRDVNQIAHDAQAYFPVPDPHLQPNWVQMLAEAAMGSDECTKALEQGDSSAFNSALMSIADAASTGTELMSATKVEIERYGRKT